MLQLFFRLNWIVITIFIGILYLSLPTYGQFGTPSYSVNEANDLKVGAGFGVANRMYQGEVAYSPFQNIGMALTWHHQKYNRETLSENRLFRYMVEGRIGGYYFFDNGSGQYESDKNGILLEGYLGYGQGQRKDERVFLNNIGVVRRQHHYVMDFQKYFLQGSASLLRNTFQGTLGLKYGRFDYTSVFFEGSWDVSFYEKIHILEKEPRRNFVEAILKLQFWGKWASFYATISFVSRNEYYVIDNFYRNVHIGTVIDLNFIQNR